jgi:tetratricopeptide (TPR) repeat protein
MNRNAFAGIYKGFAGVIKMGLWVALAAILSACVMPDGMVVNSWPPVLNKTTSPADASPADAWIEEGKQAGRQNDLATALADFNQAIAADPSNVAAYFYRAYIYHLQGNDQAALADQESYLALNPWDAKAFLALQQRRQSLAAYDAMLAQYEKSAATPANDAESAYDEGMHALLRGRLLGSADEVITATVAFTTSIAADPTLAAAYHKRALAELATVGGGGDSVTGMQMNGRSGTVERIDAASGKPYTQTLESYQAEMNAAALQSSQIAALAAADLQQALKLDPSSAEAANDLAVLYALYGMGESTPITDALGVAGALFETNPSDEARQHGQAAALPLFDQAVKSAPEWLVARRNRAMAKLMESIALVNSDDKEALQKALASAQIAKEDADYIISHADNDDNADGWPYYMRYLATGILAKLTGTEVDNAPSKDDSLQFHLRTPNVNYDFRLQEAANQLRFSLSVPPPKPILDGRLAFSGTDMLLVNDALGITLTIPTFAPNHLLASVAISGAHYVALRDDFRVIDIVALDSPVGDTTIGASPINKAGMEQWITENFLPFYPDAQIQAQPLQTQNGAATLVEVGDQHYAFFNAGGRIYSVAYQLGTSANFAGGYNINTMPANSVLREIIERLTFDNQGATK